MIRVRGGMLLAAVENEERGEEIQVDSTARAMPSKNASESFNVKSFENVSCRLELLFRHEMCCLLSEKALADVHLFVLL